MGFADQARKIWEYNRGLLREKSFFKDIGKTKGKRQPSKIDLLHFKNKSQSLDKKHRERRLVSVLVMYPVFVALLALVIWLLFY